MLRYRNNTMMPASVQRMMANEGNTMTESSITRIMRRGELCYFNHKCRSFTLTIIISIVSKHQRGSFKNQRIFFKLLGLRRKYAKGCKQGCQVKTVYWATTSKSKEFCYWNVYEFRRPQVDCRKTTQFCYRGKDGYCQWKATKEYKKCLQRNKLP